MKCANVDKAVFLDRDGTLIEDRGHLRDPSEVVFFPDTINALRRLQEHFLLFIVTNQPGIAKGIVSKSHVEQVNAYVVGQLADADVRITNIYVCPHKRADGCQCIKPNPYFLRKAAHDYRVDLLRSFTVGDHPFNIELAENVAACGVFVLTGHGRKHRDELKSGVPIMSGIAEAAHWILRSARLNIRNSTEDIAP